MIVGKLSMDAPGKSFLVLSKNLDKTNCSTIACSVRDALRILWPGEDREDKVLLLLTDSAAYMLKAGEVLSAIYPKMLHVTCLAHGLHRVAEEVRNNFPEVNMLISSVKKIFLKAPSRVQAFREILPGVSLPPEPILTRWGTWLSAALYYAEHFEKIKEVVNALDVNEATAISKALKILQSKEICGALAFLRANFSDFPNSIEKLESSKLELKDADSILKKDIPGPVGEAVSSKLNQVL